MPTPQSAAHPDWLLWCCCVILCGWGVAMADVGAGEEGPYLYSIHPGSPLMTRSGNESEMLSAHRVKREMRRPPYTSKEKKAMLDIHNSLRGKTKATDMLMLDWNNDLEMEAQRWADECDFNHPKEPRSVGGFDGLGQNLFVATALPPRVTDPMQSWYDEIQDYTYSADSTCVEGKMCGHYTQIVWAQTRAVGCSFQYCDPLTSTRFKDPKGYLIVCEYGPAGNYYGQYPYQAGNPCSSCPDEYKYCVKNLCSKVEGDGATGLHYHNLPTLLAKVMACVMVSVIATASIQLRH